MVSAADNMMGDDRKLNVTVVPALVIRPGDAVLLNVGADADVAEWRPVLDQLRERFPEVEFALLGGVEQIAVKPGQDERVQHFEQELTEAHAEIDRLNEARGVDAEREVQLHDRLAQAHERVDYRGRGG
jgi:hypothetical protein